MNLSRLMQLFLQRFLQPLLQCCALVVCVLANLAPSAWAQTPTPAGAPFFCDAQFYQTRSDIGGGATTNTGYLVRFPTLTTAPTNIYGGATTFTPALNALGFNPRDNYLYAVGIDVAPNSNLYRLGQTGLELVGAISGLTGYSVATAGVFDKQGRYYLLGQGAGNNVVPNTVFRIDNIPATGTAALTVARSYAINVSITNIGDFAFSDAADGINGTLYGATNQGVNTLAQIVLNDAAATATATTRTWANPSIGGVGSAFYDQPSDKFYVFNNGASTFYEITGFAGTTPGAVTVTGIAPTFIAPGFTNSATDGTSCILAGAQQADLNLRKTVVPLTAVTAGQTVTFTIAIGNLAGGSPAQNVNITDQLPPGLNFVSASTTSGTYNTPTWIIASLPSGTTQTLTLVATVRTSGTTTASFANVATVGSVSQAGTTTVIPLPDPVSGNNTSTATASVAASANLGIAKTNATTTVPAGGTTVYTVTVSNLTGSFDVANALLKDSVTPGLQCTATPTCTVTPAAGGTCPTPGAGIGQLSMANMQSAGGVVIPLLRAGASMAFVITCRVSATGL